MTMMRFFKILRLDFLVFFSAVVAAAVFGVYNLIFGIIYSIPTLMIIYSTVDWIRPDMENDPIIFVWIFGTIAFWILWAYVVFLMSRVAQKQYTPLVSAYMWCSDILGKGLRKYMKYIEKYEVD